MDSGTGTGTPGRACACLRSGCCVGVGVALTVAAGAVGAGIAAAETGFGVGLDGAETALAGCDGAGVSETTVLLEPQAERAKDKVRMERNPEARRKLR